MLESSGVDQYTLEDIRKLPGGSTRHLIKIPKEYFRKIPEEKFSISTSTGEALFDSNGCDVCKTILSHKSFLVSARHMSDYTIVYNFVVPNHEEFQSIISTLEKTWIRPKDLGSNEVQA